MEFTAKQIAEFLNGEIEGNPDVKVSDVSRIEEGRKGSLSFLANPKYEKYIYETESSIVLVNKTFQPVRPVKTTLIRVENAYESFARLLELYTSGIQKQAGISSLASIRENSTIGQNVYIGEFTCITEKAVIADGVRIYPQVYIGENVSIGKNTTIHAGVKIYHNCSVGADCIIHSGTVIGSDGFGFAPQDGVYKKIPQIGNVVIEDDVEIGANVTIDRATIGSTIIRKGVKLDNLIQIAHNVEIGENSVVVAQAGIAGSTKIGKNCTIAAQAGIVGHITITDNVIIAAQAGVSHDLRNKGEVVLGSPAFKINEFKRSSAIFKSLPNLRNTVIELQREIENLKKKLNC